MDNYINNHPTIQGEIIIHSDFPINCGEIQQLLGICPTSCQQKGEKIRENLFAKCSSWFYSTEEIETLNIEDVTDVLMNMLKGKEERLYEYMLNNSLHFKFGFAIRHLSEEYPFPGIFFSRKFIGVCNKLNAEIDVDVSWFILPLPLEYEVK